MAETKRYISKEELKTHNRVGDLWISIQGKIYNVSDWAKEHLGGFAPLLSLAGQDATDVFVAYHPGVLWSCLDDFFTRFHLKDYAVSEASRDYRRLVYEFSKMGLFEKKGHGVFVMLCAMAVMFSARVYRVLGCDNTWVHLANGALMGLFWIQSGWIGHDSGHYQVMMNRRLNHFAQVLSGNCLAELEDAADGPGGMGQHSTPPRLERNGDEIPLTYPALSMGRG